MATERATRKTRTPIGDTARYRLRVQGKDPNYEYYIVNDVDDRVSQMQADGWEVVTDKDVTVGDRRVSVPSSEGSAKTVSVGGGTTGVVMKIKKEWWEEDQLAKQSRTQAFLKETASEAEKSNDFGSIKTGSSKE